jgi:hypothetical protein
MSAEQRTSNDQTLDLVGALKDLAVLRRAVLRGFWQS